MNKIVTIDDFFKKETHLDLNKFCFNASYNFNEFDRSGVPPIGGSYVINSQDKIFNFLSDNIKNNVEILKNTSCYRQTINIFLPNENPYFHTDSEGLSYTCLYYPNLNYDLDEGGETQFIINGEIKGILPKPNRLVIFDGRIQHRATSFRTQHRFTYAIKYIL
jgi:hypothetical protein